MARGSGAAIRAARQKGTTALAWASFGVAIVGGTFAAGMWIGEVIRTLLDALPWPWVPALLLLIAVVGVGIDLFVDGAPNQVAIYGGILTPSIATAADGKLGNSISDWTADLVNWLNGSLVEWLGTGSAVGLALACIICSLLMARRVVRKSAGAPAGARGGGPL
ncbi:hypothetical protein ABGB07_44890 [Micromonosporaceae bacterium B7E4]